MGKLRAIELALKTWYDKDHPLHFEPLHPVLGLAGEAGELLDLYKKELYKEGVSWWDCAKCKMAKGYHFERDRIKFCSIDGATYTPKVLDELGDLWYYLRILAYQLELPVATPLLQTHRPSVIIILTFLNSSAAELLEQLLPSDKIDIELLNQVNYCFPVTIDRS